MINSNVMIQDQSTEIIDLHVTREVQEIDIVTNTSLYDTTITISSSAEPTDGNMVCLKEGTSFYQGEILSHSANGGNWDVNVDNPLDYAYTTQGGCSERSFQLNIDGSITPVVFSVSPSNLNKDVKWDITRVMGAITDTVAMDDDKFGGITKLAKGILLRCVNGTVKNIFNAKSNSDIRVHAYDLTYSDKAPAGSYGLNFRRTFAGQDKNGVVVRLSAERQDELQVLVQDDLTGLSSFTMVAQGHLVEDD